MKTLFGMICLLYCGIAYSARFPAIRVERIRQVNVGIDIGQFNYFIGAHKKGMHLGLFAQYKPFYFLAFNSSFFYNNLSSQRPFHRYAHLVDYHSRGSALKVGAELSLRLSRQKRDNRFFIGYQSIFCAYRESGRFELNGLYWGDHVHAFDSRSGLQHAREIIFGFQFAKKNWIIRPQFYTVSLDDEIRISHKDEVVTGYRSPFVPGMGFRRGGLNLIVAYRF